MEGEALDHKGYGVKVPKTARTRGVLYLRNIPAVVKNLFKATAVRRQEYMEDVVCELMRKYIEDPGCVARWKKKRTRKGKKK